MRDVKFCPECKQEKPITDYTKCRTRSDGLCWRCKTCHNVWGKIRRQKLKERGGHDPDPTLETKRCSVCKSEKSISDFYKSRNELDGYNRTCTPCWKKRQKVRGAAIRNQKRVKKYGITPIQFEDMLKAQGNKCAICPATIPTTQRGWMVDHCHDTGVVRGIVCSLCNLMLGMAKDNPEVLRAGAAYLENMKTS